MVSLVAEFLAIMAQNIWFKFSPNPLKDPLTRETDTKKGEQCLKTSIRESQHLQ